MYPLWKAFLIKEPQESLIAQFSRYTKEPKRNRSLKGYMKDFEFFSVSVNAKFETFDGNGLSGSMEDSFFSQ